MPKHVFDDFFLKMLKHIRTEYKVGEKYLSIREIAASFGVSLQTAQRGVQKLVECGMIQVRQKSGITIVAVRPLRMVAGRKILVISNQNDEHFTDAFMRGIDSVSSERGIEVIFQDNHRSDVSSLDFGEYLLSFGADGIIALSFRDSALPFYHVMREGVDIIADVILDELPVLPAIQTDNHLHARNAGRLMIERGYSRLLVVGYYAQAGNHRYEGFSEVVKDHGASVEYVCLSEIDAMKRLDRFFNTFSPDCAVFSNDYSASYVVGAKFIQFGLRVSNDNFIVYDSEDEYFHYSGLGDVRAIAPSLVEIGTELCSALVAKWESGAFPLPLQRRI